tara:strand:+ start:941 stop:1138 length:198 start_codon:yes stop_codon:yes gene_type:complete
MKYYPQKNRQNNGGRSFIFECAYFDENGNMNSSKKFTKAIMPSEKESLNSSGLFETRNFDLALNV